MCGLFGFVNRDLTKLKLTDLINQSLILNSLRGIDGAGVALVDPKGEVHMYKRPLPGWDLLQLSPTRSIIANCDLPVFGAVHNRAGTSGGNKVDTSHPIGYKHITLVHNGSVHSLHSLGADYLTHDSTAIAMALADKTEKEALELIQGSYALMWYNGEDKTFNVARNDDRPLYAAAVKKSKTLLFGSESGMLLWLAERNDIELASVTSLPIAVHTKFSIDPTVKPKASKFTIHVAPALPQRGNTPLSNWGYTPTALNSVFVAMYDGTLIGNDGIKTFKFKRKGDPMYGWLTPYEPAIEDMLIEKKEYRLRCVEARFASSNSSNLKAELLSTVAEDTTVIQLPNPIKDLYKPGQEVEFTAEVMYASSKDASKRMLIGYTDDSGMVEVRAPQVTNPNIEKDIKYIGTIKAVIQGNKQPYLLLDSASIKLPRGQTTLDLCGWCNDPLTLQESRNNDIPGMSNGEALCNKCMAQFNMCAN